MMMNLRNGYAVAGAEKKFSEQLVILMSVLNIRVDAVDGNIITCERQDLIMNTNELELDVTTKIETLISIIDEDE